MSFGSNVMPKRFGAGAKTVRHGSSALTPEQSDQTEQITGERYLHIQRTPQKLPRRERRLQKFQPRRET